MSAIRAPLTVSWAASSSGSSSGLRNASRKTASIRVCVALPPAPCDIVTRSSLTLGRRRRARSIRSSTCCSRPSGLGQRQLAPSLGGEALVPKLGLGQGLVYPALAHDPATPASATRLRFIRPKL